MPTGMYSSILWYAEHSDIIPVTLVSVPDENTSYSYVGFSVQLHVGVSDEQLRILRTFHGALGSGNINNFHLRSTTVYPDFAPTAPYATLTNRTKRNRGRQRLTHQMTSIPFIDASLALRVRQQPDQDTIPIKAEDLNKLRNAYEVIIGIKSLPIIEVRQPAANNPELHALMRYVHTHPEVSIKGNLSYDESHEQQPFMFRMNPYHITPSITAIAVHTTQHGMGADIHTIVYASYDTLM